MGRAQQQAERKRATPTQCVERGRALVRFAGDAAKKLDGASDLPACLSLRVPVYMSGN